jgi:hypothetical protein
MSLFHKHEWKILSETTTKSGLEHTVEVSVKAGLSLERCQESTHRKLIQIVTCKCGKLKKLVEDL